MIQYRCLKNACSKARAIPPTTDNHHNKVYNIHVHTLRTKLITKQSYIDSTTLGITIFRCPILYLPQILEVSDSQNAFIPCLGGLYSLRRNSLNWVKIRVGCLCFPPIDLIVFIPPLSTRDHRVAYIGGHLDMQPPRMEGDHSSRYQHIELL